MKFKVSIVVGSLVAILAGVMMVMIALGDKIARWAGFAESLPFLGLLVLFITGHFVVMTLIPSRVRH